jgi:hypothetical protein
MPAVDHFLVEAFSLADGETAKGRGAHQTSPPQVLQKQVIAAAMLAETKRMMEWSSFAGVLYMLIHH